MLTYKSSFILYFSLSFLILSIFSLQLNSSTRSLQLSAWTNKLIELAQAGSSSSRGKGYLSVCPVSLSIFTNSKLSRTLSLRGIRAIFLNLQEKSKIQMII